MESEPEDSEKLVDMAQELTAQTEDDCTMWTYLYFVPIVFIVYLIAVLIWYWESLFNTNLCSIM